MDKINNKDWNECVDKLDVLSNNIFFNIMDLIKETIGTNNVKKLTMEYEALEERVKNELINYYYLLSDYFDKKK